MLFPLFKQNSNNDLTADSPIHWMAMVRIISLLFIIGSLIFRWNLNLYHYDPQGLFYACLLYLLSGLILFILAKKAKALQERKRLIVYAELLMDLFFITLIVHLSGGMQSRLAFLYIIPVFSSALIFAWGGIITGVATLALYYGLIYFEQINFIKLVSVSISADPYFSQIQLIRQAIIVLIVAFSGAYYFHSIKKLNDALLKLKDEFLFRTVHDIRSPATAIRWLLEKYQRKEFRERYPEIQEDIAEVEGLLVRISKLTENILILAKGQRIEIKKELVSVPSIVESILKEVQPGIIEKNIKLEYDTPQNLPMVLANSELLKEAFANIIGNAVKYNKQKGRLEIRHKIENNFLRTTIINAGPRIALEDVKKLFTPYFRGAEGEKIKGTGLGLYVSQKIIAELDGSIGVESSSEEQTVFYISLPLPPTKS